MTKYLIPAVAVALVAGALFAAHIYNTSGASLPLCRSLARSTWDAEHERGLLTTGAELGAQLDTMARLHCGPPVGPSAAEVAQAAAEAKAYDEMVNLANREKAAERPPCHPPYACPVP